VATRPVRKKRAPPTGPERTAHGVLAGLIRHRRSRRGDFFVRHQFSEEVLKDREILLSGCAGSGDRLARCSAVADLLREVGGVEDELRLKRSTPLFGGQEAQVRAADRNHHRLVLRSRRARFIAACAQSNPPQGFFFFDAAAESLVEQEPEKFEPCSSASRKLHKQPCGLRDELGRRRSRIRRANE